ncbi:uncharacterized protein M6B38_325965 [Iris pallida]|uniref:Uncharacterized protein n=1 Tax=Iris pallida TaxID=29817 RepID=A0AAX6ERB7_IRIPA|nr:uncharacterized protein M6B38_173945 [Iris pallida]KAJ6836647.1 uncharacterized protein M6B38_325965 [Iris pallida]
MLKETEVAEEGKRGRLTGVRSVAAALWLGEARAVAGNGSRRGARPLCCGKGNPTAPAAWSGICSASEARSGCGDVDGVPEQGARGRCAKCSTTGGAQARPPRRVAARDWTQAGPDAVAHGGSSSRTRRRGSGACRTTEDGRRRGGRVSHRGEIGGQARLFARRGRKEACGNGEGAALLAWRRRTWLRARRVGTGTHEGGARQGGAQEEWRSSSRARAWRRSPGGGGSAGVAGLRAASTETHTAVPLP